MLHNISEQLLPLFFSITSSYHIDLASLTFSAMSITLHLLLNSSFHNASEQLSFISSYDMSTPSQLASLIFSAMPTTPHLLLISSFHNVSDKISFISSYYMSIPSQPCLPYLLYNVYPFHIFFSSLHSMMSLTSSPASKLLHCLPHLHLVSPFLSFSVAKPQGSQHLHLRPSC